MTETEHEKVAPADHGGADLQRLLHPAFDRFEKRHYAGLAASIALHLAILMGVRWAVHPQPPRPLTVEVELVPAEPTKASRRSALAQAKPIAETSRARQTIKPPKEPKPTPLTPDQEMTMQVIQAAPAKVRKRADKGRGAAPAVALPGTSSPQSGTSQTQPGQAPAAAALQQAIQRGTLRPRVASAGQQASSRQQMKPASGVESEKGPALIASNAPAAQTLAPEYRHSSSRGGLLSSEGGAAQTAMGGGPRSEASQPYSLQASGAGSSPLLAKGPQRGALASAPVPNGVARSGGLAPSEVRSSGGQVASAGASTLAPDQARGTGIADKLAAVSSAASASRAGGMSPTEIRSSGGEVASAAGSAIAPDQVRGAGGADKLAAASSTAGASRAGGMSPTEIRSSGGQSASTAGSSVAPGQARGAGGAAGAAASAAGAGEGGGRGLPTEGRAAAGLQGSGGTGASAFAGRGSGAGDFSRPGGGAASSVDEGAAGGGQLLASAGPAGSLGPEIRSMSAAIVPDSGPATVSRVTDDIGTAPMQRIEMQAVTHQIDEDRYQSKSLKVHSPRTFCELPLMLAGFDRKPLPEGLASIMGSESAKVMEAPPELLPGNLQPTYPPAAMIGNHKGIVTIRAQVLANGQVGEMFVRPPRAATVLEQAAMDTVRRWRFKPARRNGEPVSSWVNIPIEYRNPT